MYAMLYASVGFTYYTVIYARTCPVISKTNIITIIITMHHLPSLAVRHCCVAHSTHSAQQIIRDTCRTRTHCRKYAQALKTTTACLAGRRVEGGADLTQVFSRLIVNLMHVCTCSMCENVYLKSGCRGGGGGYKPYCRWHTEEEKN